MERTTLSKLLFGERGTQVFLAVLLTLTVLVPVLHLAVPVDSALHLSTYTMTLMGKYLTYALLAVSVDLIWGYCGILSLGHAAFFALGGYAMGMYLMRQIGTRGVYGDPVLTDFMVFLNYQELPWFWHGFDMFWFASLMVVLAPGLLALVFGWLAFRSRVTGVYLSIITQALTYALQQAFLQNNMGFGGNNGLTDFKDVLGFPINAPGTRVGLFLASAIALLLGYLACRYITMSRAGRVVQAVRDAESRTRFIGFRVENYKLWMFVFSAILAGIAGALYVPQVGIINPSEFSPVNSIEVVIWVAVGGRATLYGAVVGPVLVNYAKTFFTTALPEVWQYALGALFILVTLFLPRGVAALLERQRARKPEAPPALSQRVNAAKVMKQGWQKVFGAGARSDRPVAGDASHGTILYVEDITVSFDGFKALNALTLYIDVGELRCIIGPNGAGKTTMMDVITGKTRPDSGSAWFGITTDLLTLTEPQIAEIGIGRKFQKPTVFEQLDVVQNLALAAAGDKRVWHTLFKPLTAEQRARIDEVLLTIGLRDQRATRAGILSHGQKQWLEIGMLLMQDPRLLLVDEPVAGMTPQEVERTAELLLSLAGRHSVVVVEHDMEFVRSIARTVTVLHEGSVLAEGSMDEVQNDPKVIEVYLGEVQH